MNRFARRHVLPGFALSLGVTLLWTGIVVALPLLALILRPWRDGGRAFLHALADARLHAALELSFGSAILAVGIDALLGLLLAWVLVRVKPPGYRLMGALIDLPFAIPPAVTGITLATLYGAQGWIGALLAKAGLRVAFTPAAIVIALAFVGLPFVVRAVESVLRGATEDVEEAAWLLGATAPQRFFRVLLPAVMPALLSGIGLAFARAIGEYGSVIFVAGNRPFHSEIAPLLIIVRIQEFNYEAATAIALILLVASFLCLLLVSAVRRLASAGIAEAEA